MCSPREVEGIKKRRKDDLSGNTEEYVNIYLFFLNNWQSLHPDYEVLIARGSECVS